MIEFQRLNFGFGETLEMLRDTVRDFAAQEIAPRAAEIDRDNSFRADLWPKLGGTGPARHHGRARSTAAPAWAIWRTCVAMEEIRRASASVGLSYGAHSNLCVNQIHRNGTPTQKRAIPAQADLRRACRRAGHERAGAGSDVVSMKLRAEQTGRPLRPQRHQDVDHQRPRCRHAGGLCQDRSGRRRRAASPPS